MGDDDLAPSTPAIIAGMITNVSWFIASDCALDGVPLPAVAKVSRHHDPRPATWSIGALVSVTDGVTWLVPHEEARSGSVAGSCRQPAGTAVCPSNS